MHDSAFDVFTRRAAGISRRVSLLALAAAVTPALAAAKKQSRKKDNKKKKTNKKKPCKNLGDGCTPGGKRKCCGELICSTIGKGIGLEGPERCCKQPGEPCTAFDDCCSAFCLNDGPGTPGTCLDT